jgi:hypothetical protein
MVTRSQYIDTTPFVKKNETSRKRKNFVRTLCVPKLFLVGVININPFTPIIVKNNQKWLFFTKA